MERQGRLALIDQRRDMAWIDTLPQFGQLAGVTQPVQKPAKPFLRSQDR
jgi:hypothetical protein